MRYTRWLSALSDTPEFGILFFSFFLNLAWEVWQVPFFRGMAEQPHWLGVRVCTQATFGDMAITLTAFWVAAVFAKSRRWVLRPKKADVAVFVGTGLAVTILLEALATGALDRWTYAETMPRLPVLGTGLLPFLQWLLLPPVVLWMVRRQM